MIMNDCNAGKTLGGCSAINGAHWTQPTGRDVKSWGFAGLSANAAKRLFKKAAAQVQPAKPPKSLRQTYLQEWLAAARKSGLKVVNGSGPHTGTGRDAAWLLSMAATNSGQRRDACTAYLSPVMGRGKQCASNLKLIQSATVSKVRVRGAKATAVEYYTGSSARGTPRVISARREVILSAGPFGSAKILQLSGIGPAGVLRRRGIAVKKARPGLHAACVASPCAYLLRILRVLYLPAAAAQQPAHAPQTSRDQRLRGRASRRVCRTCLSARACRCARFRS